MKRGTIRMLLHLIISVREKEPFASRLMIRASEQILRCVVVSIRAAAAYYAARNCYISIIISISFSPQHVWLRLPGIQLTINDHQ